MKYLNLFEYRFDSKDNIDYLFWLSEWIKINFGDYKFASGQINYDYQYIKGTHVHVNIFYSQGLELQIDDMEKIVNFYNYLIDEKIIFDKSQLNIQNRGQFIVQLKIDIDIIKNHPSLTVFRDAKKYNL
jgi:hypothetical protein